MLARRRSCFADVSGSTKLYETAGNAVAHAAVESCVNADAAEDRRPRRAA